PYCLLCGGPSTPLTFPLSLHDALPICLVSPYKQGGVAMQGVQQQPLIGDAATRSRAVLPVRVFWLPPRQTHLDRLKLHPLLQPRDRKSTRLNSSHVKISYAVFCLKKTR